MLDKREIQRDLLGNFVALSDNPFIDMPLADIQALQTTYLQVLNDIATGGKSYSFPGRSFTRADLGQVKEILNDLRVAVRYISGTGSRQAQVRINTSRQFSVSDYW